MSRVHPEIAVIILNWNGANLLREFLPQVIANTDPNLADIFVADNGSTDDSLSVLAEDFPQVQVIRLDENYGYAGGYNRAVEACKDYPYVILLNSDVAPRPNWIQPLYQYMQRHPDVGACQPKILSYTSPDTFEYAGAAGGLLDRNGYPYCRGRIFSHIEKDKGQYDEPAEIFWATGAALMIRTDIYLKLGGLDEQFFAHMEEIDLCWRLKLAGWRIMVVPESEVLHLGGASLPASNPRKTYLNFRNNLLMLHKNLPDSTRTGHIFRRMILDGLAWIKFAITGHFSDAAAIWRAHRDFRAMRQQYTHHPDIDLIADAPNILLRQK